MKKIIILVLFSLIALFEVHAQSCRSGSYYSKRWSVSDVCGTTYSVPQYNNWGYISGYAYYKNCRRAHWHSAIGGHYVYIWDGYTWQYVWRTGTYWWYEWVNYTIRVR